MKKLVVSTYNRQLRTAIQIWFKKGLNPMKSCKQQKGLEHLIQQVGGEEIKQSKWTGDQDA